MPRPDFVVFVRIVDSAALADSCDACGREIAPFEFFDEMGAIDFAVYCNALADIGAFLDWPGAQDKAKSMGGRYSIDNVMMARALARKARIEAQDNRFSEEHGYQRTVEAPGQN